MKLNGTIWECPDSMYGAKIEFPIDDEGFGVFTKYSDKIALFISYWCKIVFRGKIITMCLLAFFHIYYIFCFFC